MKVLLLSAALITLATTAGAQGQSSVKHPVLNHQLSVRNAAVAERAVSRVMAMSEAEMVRLVPTKSGIVFCGCPNCSGGQQENGMFAWDIERPFELRCKFCGHVYPSQKYPMNQTATGVNALGETVSYRYYFDEKSQRDFWFEAHADMLRRYWFVNQCLALAETYHVTRKPEYARRAALILDTFAQAYPRMAVLKQWPYTRRAVAKPTPPFPHAGGKWGRWSASEVPGSLPEAYDLVCDSEELDKLSKERGADVRRRIEHDFFRATVEYMFTFSKKPIGVHLNNMAPHYTRHIVDIGRVIGEPAYVHWGHRWVGNILRDGFFYDGMWHEAPAYHYQTIGGVQMVIAALKGYSDPPGYRDAVDGTRFDNLDLASQSPLVQKALHAPELIAYPNGRICPVHDTWASTRSITPRDQTVSTLLPGYGHASLGRGRGADQMQAQLHFSGAYGHSHADNLNFSLFAKGSELISDIGYSHTKLRRWTISTIGHNTVAIDRKEQTGRNSDGDLLLFVPDLNGLSAVEACGKRAYPGVAEVYRRLLILVPVSDSDAYVVDILRVSGGSTHDWLLHGSADSDMTAECSLSLTPREGTMLEPGEEWKEPLGESSSFNPYGLMRDVRAGKTEGVFDVTFRNADGGVRTHVLGGESEVFLCKTPRIRQAEGDDRKVYDHWMPQLVVRKRGDAPLSRVFVAVHEPFRGKSFINGAVCWILAAHGGAVLKLEVCHGGFTDKITVHRTGDPASSRRPHLVPTSSDHLQVSREGLGRQLATWTVETARHTGVIESATRKADGAAEDAFITPAELPGGDTLAGRWMVVTHGNGHTHGYEIARVERRDGKSVIILRDDHRLKITGDQTQELCFPRRKITGPNQFVIAGLAVK